VKIAKLTGGKFIVYGLRKLFDPQPKIRPSVKISLQDNWWQFF